MRNPDNKKHSRRILLIITGSIAAYKAIDLIRKLQKKHYEVKVILTDSAQKFITKLLVTSLIGKSNLHNEIFNENDPMSHISLSRDHDLVVIAPATANFIGKIANGICDDLASAVVSASNKDIIIAPAMNIKMWQNKANAINISKITSSDKIFLINPIEDILACKERGIGKMESVTNIIKNIDEFYQLRNSLTSYTTIITGGGTREAIDSVRFIGNSSSGKQAIELANILKRCGTKIKFIAANISQDINLSNKNIIKVKSCDEMDEKVQEELQKCSDKDKVIFISCAAVADFKPDKASKTKIKKESQDNININLVKNIDILKKVATSKDRPGIVIGFAAEDKKDIIKNAKIKLKSKNCDLIIANDIKGGQIFNSEKSNSYIISNDHTQEIKEKTKKGVAKAVILEILDLI